MRRSAQDELLTLREEKRELSEELEEMRQAMAVRAPCPCARPVLVYPALCPGASSQGATRWPEPQIGSGRGRER